MISIRTDNLYKYAGINSFKQLTAVIIFLDQEGQETILVRDTNCDDISFKNLLVDSNYNIPNHVGHLDKIYEHYGYTQKLKE